MYRHQLCLWPSHQIFKFCGVVANIAEHVETHPMLVYEQAIHFLVFLMRSRHLDVHREATRAIVYLFK